MPLGRRASADHSSLSKQRRLAGRPSRCTRQTSARQRDPRAWRPRQLDNHGRVMPAAARLTLQSCQHAIGSAHPCTTRCPGFWNSAAHHTAALCAPTGRWTSFAAGSFDRADFFASGWLPRLSRSASWRRSAEIRCWLSGRLVSNSACFVKISACFIKYVAGTYLARFVERMRDLS